MSQAVLWENNSAQAVGAAHEGGEGLRLSAAELEAVTGWTSKPEGPLPVRPRGIEHSLSDYRGRKIFLLTWGSY